MTTWLPFPLNRASVFSFICLKSYSVTEEKERIKGYILEGIRRSLALPPKLDLNLNTFVNILCSSLIVHSELLNWNSLYSVLAMLSLSWCSNVPELLSSVSFLKNLPPLSSLDPYPVGFERQFG